MGVQAQCFALFAALCWAACAAENLQVCALIAQKVNALWTHFQKRPRTHHRDLRSPGHMWQHNQAAARCHGECRNQRDSAFPRLHAPPAAWHPPCTPACPTWSSGTPASGSQPEVSTLVSCLTPLPPWPQGFRLHSHEVAYSRGSQQQSVTAYPTGDDANSLWVVHGTPVSRSCWVVPIPCMPSLLRLWMQLAAAYKGSRFAVVQ